MQPDIANRFSLVGVRYTLYSYDESTLFAAAKLSEKGVTSYYEIQSEDPVISDQSYKDRPVIEILLKIHQTIELPVKDDSKAKFGKSSRSKEGVRSETVLAVHCVAGFVGVDEIDDGNIELFSQAEDSFARAVYWVARQRVRSLTVSTVLDSGGLPVDVHSSKTGKSKAAKQPKKKSKPKR